MFRNCDSRDVLSGYRDALLNVRYEGFVCEVQLHFQMFYSTDKLHESHALYEYFRRQFQRNDDRTKQWLDTMEGLRKGGVRGNLENMLTFALEHCTDLEVLEKFWKCTVGAGLWDKAERVSERGVCVAVTKDGRGTIIHAHWLNLLGICLNSTVSPRLRPICRLLSTDSFGPSSGPAQIRLTKSRFPPRILQVQQSHPADRVHVRAGSSQECV